MADNTFTLPDLNKNTDKPSMITQEVNNLTGGLVQGHKISSKEMMFAGGAVLVAVIIFFIIKNSVSKMLVASYRKSPRSAEMAGWSLFCILFLASVAAALGTLDSTRLLSLPYLIPLGLAMLVSLVMFIVAILSKR
ncbi:MAG: hypothetical protein K0B37_10415 [Bacteroidales bacterium]|nr:hypothetical protein [Bacteroidales bacterium]